MKLWRAHVDAHSYWSTILANGRFEEDEIAEIRAGTRAGRAIGSEAFKKEIARRLGRPWPPKKRGRRKKSDGRATAAAKR